VAEALERAAGAAPRLKWPNDVLLAGRKVAGILAEGIVGTRPVVLLGIGVNVARPGRDDWPPELSRRATALAAHATAVARERVLRAILDRLAAWYDVLLTEGFPPVREAWRRRAVLGSRVAGPGGPGLAVDLAAGGELVVRHRDGRTSVLVAEPLEAPAHDGVPAPVSGRG
jgi:BirA family biotin operon repressor/biotin-[acetyl-CoA-carboxylase] ligase